MSTNKHACCVCGDSYDCGDDVDNGGDDNDDGGDDGEDGGSRV